MSCHRSAKNCLSPRPILTRHRLKRQVLLQLEELETRALLSASSVTPTEPVTTPANNDSAQPLLIVTLHHVSPQLSPGVPGYTPQQIRQAYGVRTLLSGGTNGKGETIAIVDAYNDPKIWSDLSTFDTHFQLANPPSLTVMNQSGQVLSTNGMNTSVTPPSADSSGGWELEESLDVEWAHAVAPGAKIVLVEANSSSLSDLMTAVQTAAKKASVVSMSWGGSEFNGESSNDSYFVPPSTNPGVTFVAASGDSGGYYPFYPYYNQALYPAVSPYVLSAGGTALYLTSTNNYSSETAWSGSGGGPAQYEGEPSYQYNQPSIGSPDVALYNSFTGTYSYYSARTGSDVAYNADPYTGYAVYDSIASPYYGFSGGWIELGGTSAAAPQWSALVALTNQYRFVHDGGKSPLDTYQVQTTLYNTLSNGTAYGNGDYGKVFHDIQTGSNGPWNAGPGYDWVTGLGTPIANNLVPLLAGTTISQGLPSIKGSGYGTGFGTTTFYSTSYFAGSSASSRGGGGLYSNSGSLSIPPISQGVNGLGGQTVGAAANAPLSTPSLLFTFTPIAAPLDAPPAGTPTGTSNFVGNVSTLAPGSPSAAFSTSLAESTNAPAAQNNLMLGASGWNGSPSSLRLSNLGISGQMIDQRADDLNGNLEDVTDSSADNGLDDSGADWSLLDVMAPPLLDGDAVVAGDSGDCGE